MTLLAIKIPGLPDLSNGLKGIKENLDKLIQKTEALWYDGFWRGGVTVGIILILLYLIFHRKGTSS